MSPAGTTAIDYEEILEFGKESFPIVICSGSGARDDLAARLARMEADMFILVTTRGIPRELVEYAHWALGQSAPVTLVTLEDGEENKTDAAIGRITAAADQAQATEESVAVGLGGGGLQNMTGFFASTYKPGIRRGIRLAYLPTTVLAAADQVPTLKTSVNQTDGNGRITARNGRGTYWTPELAWCDTAWFETLPAEQKKSGIGEIIKAWMYITPDRIPELQPLLNPAAEYKPDDLVKLMVSCIEAKQLVMRHDGHEENEGQILHAGHPLGYRAEIHYGVPHGIAVSNGCLVEHRAAEILGHLDPAVRELHAALLRDAGIPLTFPAGTSAEKLVHGLRRRILPNPRKGHVDLVLLKGLGDPLVTGYRDYRGDLRRVPYTQVPEKDAIQAVRDIQAQRA